MATDTQVKDTLAWFKVDVGAVSGYGGGTAGTVSRGVLGSGRFFGVVEEFTPPSLEARQLEMPVAGDGVQWADGGLEPLVLTFSSKRYIGNLDALFMHEITLFANGALVNPGYARTQRVTARGTVRIVNPNPWQPGDTPAKQLTLDCFAYRLDEVPETGPAFTAVDINTRTLKRVIDGIDQWAPIRRALGLSSEAVG